MMLFEDFQSKEKCCTFCGSPVRERSKYCSRCGRLCAVNHWQECGPERCGNCHEMLIEGDKYCRICGTEAGAGAFEPFQNLMQCIYGPMPVKRFYKCKKCGYSWENELMISNEKYCPRCGRKKLEIKTADDDDA